MYIPFSELLIRGQHIFDSLFLISKPCVCNCPKANPYNSHISTLAHMSCI